MKSPLIVNLGMGVDSVAMLIGLHARMERPDLVIFADTGSEKPETYGYIATIDSWLVAVGFPNVTIVRRPSTAGYGSLEENCIANETLPSLAFGYKSCSLKWKADAMDRWLLGVMRGPNPVKGWAPALAARAAGLKPVKCIGYDAGPKDSKRAINRTEDENFVYRYPLREWGWDREECVRQITRAGLPVPMKSACFFCPASKPWELMVLAARHPELLLRSLAMEDRARAGKHGLKKVAGLWRKQSWRAWCEAQGIVRGNEVVMPVAELEARVAAMKPSYESDGSALTCDPGLMNGAS